MQGLSIYLSTFSPFAFNSRGLSPQTGFIWVDVTEFVYKNVTHPFALTLANFFLALARKVWDISKASSFFHGPIYHSFDVIQSVSHFIAFHGCTVQILQYISLQLCHYLFSHLSHCTTELAHLTICIVP